ncbi:MAG: hypothetical protein U9Q17_02235 [Chloroflexota bacterium]|nr:hypothetical protein [Chloroflexota bacterium]
MEEHKEHKDTEEKTPPAKPRYLKLDQWIPISVVIAIIAIVMVFRPGSSVSNQPPVIASLRAEQGVVYANESCRVECVASDGDGDELDYEWSSSEGQIAGDAAAVVWTAPDSEGIFQVAVRVSDGSEANATDFVTITVRKRHPPAIISLIADKGWVYPADICHIECHAEDQDGDILSYQWSASGGEVLGTESVAVWTAPEDEGLYHITATVSDGQGGTATDSLPITVLLGEPPVIEEFIITPIEHNYLEEYEGGYKIFRGRSCRIECVVVGGDELSYQWEVERGEISAEGPVAVWEAPTGRGGVTVTVTVSDNKGRAVTRSIFFRVETCPCAFGSD